MINKNTTICSDHFASSDFLSLKGNRWRLKPTAIPSHFPWTKNKKHMSMTSQKALEILSTDDALKQSTYLCTTSTGLITEMKPFCVTPAGELELMKLITEEQDEQKSVKNLQNEVVQLKSQLAETENKLSQSLLRLENIRHEKQLMKFYTGFSDYEALMTFYEEILESDALVMRQRSGRRSESDYGDVKAGPPCKLPLKEELFLTLVRLRTGFPELDIANWFGVSQSTASRVTNT